MVCTLCACVCHSYIILILIIAIAKLSTMASELYDVTTPTSSTHKGKLIGGIVMLCLFIAMETCVLSRCGDIEPNPGPGCEHLKL